MLVILNLINSHDISSIKINYEYLLMKQTFKYRSNYTMSVLRLIKNVILTKQFVNIIIFNNFDYVHIFSDLHIQIHFVDVQHDDALSHRKRWTNF